jgi:hypothetical protein
MQVKIIPTCVDMIISGVRSHVYARGANYVYALKPVDNGQLRIRIRPPRDPYQAQHYWLCNIQLERGLRPTRTFDSKEIIDFAERYVQPYRHRHD